MKQTVEEAVSEYIEKHVSRNENASFSAAFRAGAEWQANQFPWIKTSDNPPLPKIEIINGEKYGCAFVIGIFKGVKIPKMCCYYGYNGNYRWEDGITPDFYMNIPTFDEILEENKDVLERIKEKGD